MRVCSESVNICEYYNVPYYEKDYVDSVDFNLFKKVDMKEIIQFLTKGRGVWNYRPDINKPSNFNQAIMFSVAKMWMQFLSTRIAPALNVSNVNSFSSSSII